MSSCYYCGSKAHNIRNCNVNIEIFNIWNDMFCIYTGYNMNIEWRQLCGLKKKDLMRIACLSNVRKILTISRNRRDLDTIDMGLKLKQEKHKLINNMIERYNKNKKEVEKYRKRKYIPKNIEECPICYNKLGNAVCKTKCGHQFCTDCFVKVVSSSDNCPMCRANFKSTQQSAIDIARQISRDEITWRIDRTPLRRYN